MIIVVRNIDPHRSLPRPRPQARRDRYPNLPRTYWSVRSFFALVKISAVGPCSTSSPSSMNTVESETRAACCRHGGLPRDPEGAE